MGDRLWGIGDLRRGMGALLGCMGDLLGCIGELLRCIGELLWGMGDFLWCFGVLLIGFRFPLGTELASAFARVRCGSSLPGAERVPCRLLTFYGARSLRAQPQLRVIDAKRVSSQGIPMLQGLDGDRAEAFDVVVWVQWRGEERADTAVAGADGIGPRTGRTAGFGRQGAEEVIFHRCRVAKTAGDRI